MAVYTSLATSGTVIIIYNGVVYYWVNLSPNFLSDFIIVPWCFERLQDILKQVTHRHNWLETKRAISFIQKFIEYTFIGCKCRLRNWWSAGAWNFLLGTALYVCVCMCRGGGGVWFRVILSVLEKEKDLVIENWSDRIFRPKCQLEQNNLWAF